jgi:hypothetical protein
MDPLNMVYNTAFLCVFDVLGISASSLVCMYFSLYVEGCPHCLISKPNLRPRVAQARRSVATASSAARRNTSSSLRASHRLFYVYLMSWEFLHLL